MHFEKIKLIGELAGLTMLAGSLIFVGFQLQQDREIARASLLQGRVEILVGRWNAGIESDTFLDAHAKVMGLKSAPWIAEFDLTTREAAALQLEAMIWWSFVETYYRQGRHDLLDEEEKAVLAQEIQVFAQFPWAYDAFERFWKPTPSVFTEYVESSLKQGKANEE